MASDLLSIGKSGARVARAALEVTSNNIANASSEGYVRRSVAVSEVANGVSLTTPSAINLSGARITGIVRNADTFRQAEVRRTGSDAARAAAEVQGLGNVEAALEQTGVYDSVVAFEGSLKQLLSDPVDGSLRAQVVEDGRTMAQTFNTAAQSLDSAAKGLQFEAKDGVDQINTTAGELARVNLRLMRSADSSSDQSALLDQRDMLLQKLSGQADITTTINPDKTVSVMLGGPTGSALVSGAAANTLAMTTTAGGTLNFTVNSQAVTLSSGAIAGKAQALVELAGARTALDGIAASIADTINTAQASGVDLQGNAGQPIFSGNDAASLKMVATGGGAVATAPAGSAAGSRDVGNLTAMRAAFDGADPAGQMDTLLFTVSSAVAGRTVTRDALDSIASSAKVALQSQAGVNLDDEAVNLMRYQQAYQASARVMQVASDLFDSILGIR
ncbi:flagellar hook-associated protein FlgK [Novosphingobium guangzhouense]|uniref:Flagellar hook-associated protein 1 n=1 Tax=Novosphingobium guangzhouense TaxID=1850347 RepID=A0A2K2FV54_9SPHN|nr:flagellar hook-associated protein FlgK [Novosphingobium guangzhouense]PNU02675.1 flagellar hook-associated protein FlgK [Novosphingobium guangzhouense]